MNSSTYFSSQNLTSQQRKKASSLNRKKPAYAVTQIAAVRNSDKPVETDANYWHILTIISGLTGSFLTTRRERLLLADSRMPLTRLESQGSEKP